MSVKREKFPKFGIISAACLLVFGPVCFAKSNKETSRPAPLIELHVDLTDAPRHLLHAHLEIPVQPGDLTLEYPQWIPGNHRPTGPIDNMTGLFLRANGQELPWRRDDVDMYGVHVSVPQGVSKLDVNFDFLAVPGATGSSDDGATSVNMAVLEWDCLLMYPAHIPVSKIPIVPSLTLPEGWKFGTALTTTKQDGAVASFAPVSVEKLVDSPLIAGKYFREIPLAPEIEPKHYLDVAGEAEEDLELKPAFLNSLSKLVRETGPLYASRHYETYHFLLSLSDFVRGQGLEHHQSSDNGVEEHGFSDENLAILNADLLPHEFTHSWNGKYRRPIGLATPDFQTPMKGDLLWVYEGMTQYWGTVLAARSGLWTPEQFRDALARTAAELDTKPGRTWRNVEDTAISAQILRGGSPGWSNWRRGQDYYQEGLLIWLDADTTIRKLTQNQKSLNDFCQKFFGLGGNTPPKVVPYTFDEVVADLNSIAPYDWRTFLMERINSHAAHATLEGIEQGGYHLVYTDQATSYERAVLARRASVDAFFSLGIRMTRDGFISDVRIGSPAYQAGLGPNMKIVAVNRIGYSGDLLKAAIRHAKGAPDPIELIISNNNEFLIIQFNYHDGEKYPRLERVADTPALLDEIIQPMTK
jgi:predicted metalloprotease with PDZ domain